MGAGKTTVGRALAKKLHMRFVDSDHEIEARTGVSIPVIFEIEGEASFRQREADVIEELSAQQGLVMATGGGAILNARSRQLLHSRGTVVYLRASVGHILQRTSHDKNRPLLRTADPRKVLEELSVQREPLYQEVAHLVVETGRPNVAFLVQSILQQLVKADAPMQAANAFLSDDNSLAINHETHHETHHEFNQAIHQAIHHVASYFSYAVPQAAQANSLIAMTKIHAAPANPINPVSAHQLVNVALGERSYPILIAPNALAQIADYVVAKRVVIVTNATIAPLYLERVTHALQQANKHVEAIILPDGEAFKTQASLDHIYEQLLRAKCDRKTTLLALGGGVIGDITGFAAASYMRGIPFVQVPTTLLSQVDSSVGGKTGINHPLGKNMIGAFYQPQAVLADTATLATLPARELSAGLAEIIKYGAIIDPAFLTWLEQHCQQLLALDNVALAYAIGRSCEIKADVVRQDEREGGLRAILNFGHTFAHAIESALGYGVWLHGEAVGCGMVMAADLSARLGYISTDDVSRISALVAAAGLPVKAPQLPFATWLEWMQVDKKNEGGLIKFILLKPIGKAVIESVPMALLEETIKACS